MNAYRITMQDGNTFVGFGRTKGEGFRNGCRKAGVPPTVLTRSIVPVRPVLTW